MEDLPDSVLEHIFFRLPILCVCTARLVCKRWKSQIEHTSFSLAYLSKESWIIVDFLSYRQSLVLFSIDNDTWYEVPLSKPPWSAPYYLTLAAASHGLLCYTPSPDLNGSIPFLGVCNPLTNDWQKINIPFKGELVQVSGFLVDNATGNFRVVLLSVEGSPVRTFVHSYDSSSGKWNFKTNSYVGISGSSPNAGVTNPLCVVKFGDLSSIGMYDVERNSWEWRKLQNQTAELDSFYVNFGLFSCQLHGLVVAFLNVRRQRLEIWKVQAEASSWELVDTAEVVRDVLVGSRSIYLSDGVDNVWILVLSCSSVIFNYNLRNKEWKLVDYPYQDRIFSSTVIASTLSLKPVVGTSNETDVEPLKRLRTC